MECGILAHDVVWFQKCLWRKDADAGMAVQGGSLESDLVALRELVNARLAHYVSAG